MVKKEDSSLFMIFWTFWTEPNLSELNICMFVWRTRTQHIKQRPFHSNFTFIQKPVPDKLFRKLGFNSNL